MYLMQEYCVQKVRMRITYDTLFQASQAMYRLNNISLQTEAQLLINFKGGGLLPLTLLESLNSGYFTLFMFSVYLKFETITELTKHISEVIIV